MTQTQPYLYMGATNSYAKMGERRDGVGRRNGNLGRCRLHHPLRCFCLVFTKPAELSRLNDPQIEKSEVVEEDDCYVIAGSSAMSTKEMFWISKESHLIRKYERSLEGASIPEFTDEQIEEGVKSLGQEVSEETKKKMRQNDGAKPKDDVDNEDEGLNNRVARARFITRVESFRLSIFAARGCSLQGIAVRWIPGRQLNVSACSLARHCLAEVRSPGW